MKTLVTGANGLLGSALKKELGNKGEYYNGKRDCNFLKPKDVKAAFLVNHDEWETIIHSAAFVGGVKANMENNKQFFEDNYNMNKNVLEAAYEYKIPNFVSILSTCVFPDKEVSYPLTAEQIENGAPHPSNYGYSYAKRLLGYETAMYRNLTGLNWISVIPTNVYGECFSDDTDIFMVDGIKNIKDVKIGDKIFTLNPATKDIEIESVISTNINYTNEFVKLKSKGVDFKITEGHKIVYETQQGNIIKKEARFLKNKIGKKYGQITLPHHNPYNISSKKINKIVDLEEYIDNNHIIHNKKIKTIRDFNHSRSRPYPTKFNLIDFVEFIGWYVSEGSYNITEFSKGGEYKNGQKTLSGITRGQICISQNKEKNPENYEQIKKILSSLGFNYGFNNKQFYFNSRLIYNYIEKNIGLGSENKMIPGEFINIDFPYELRKLLFETLMKGDGDKKGGRYTTKSKKLKDQFVYLCFGLGIKISRTEKDKNNCWRIYICQKNKKRTVKFNSLEIEKANNEKVYCITTEKNHIVYAGRNGFFNWIGQCDNFNLNDSHLIPGLIHKAYLAKRDNTDFIVWGNGTPLRQFIYSEDLAKLILWALENWKSGIPFMAVNPKEYSVKEVAFLIAKIFEIDEKSIIFDINKPSGQFKKTASTDAPKDFKFTSLEEGLRKTINWFIENYETARK